MLPKTWTTIDHLLISCHQDAQNLNPVLQILKDALPKTAIKLLILNWSDQIDFKLFEVRGAGISLTPQAQGNHLADLIQAMQKRAFAAAIILTKPDQSPYTLAYLCYLAGIPIRVGQSQEFAGGVLSTCITPSPDNISLTEYYLHPLKAVGILEPSFASNQKTLI